MKRLIYPVCKFLLQKNYKILFISVLLTGCSNMQDAINPAEWYKGARDIVTGSDSQKEEKNGTASQSTLATKENTGFEKLSTVPARPKVRSSQERNIISRGLIGDADVSRKYSNEVFGRQVKENNSLSG